MDIQELIAIVGLETVEKYLRIYCKSVIHPKSSADALLDIINKYFLKFTATRDEPPVNLEELKNYLLCFSYFKSAYRIF
nr:hypothetical protein [Crinivirus sp.]